MNSWRFSWYRSWPEVWSEELQSVWRELLAQDSSADVYHLPALVRAWAETRGAVLGATPEFALATDGAGQRLLAPWVTTSQKGRFFSRRRVESVGESYFGYTNPLSSASPDRLDLPGFWRATKTELALHCDSALLRAVDPRWGRGAPSPTRADEAPIVELAGEASLEALLGRLAASHRGDVRRCMRRLREKGPLELWVAGAEDVEHVRADLRERFVPAYRALWGSPASLFDQPSSLAFIDRIVQVGLRDGWCHYAVLRCGGESVAWHLGLWFRGDLYYWIPTYELKWSALSPGKVLLAQLIAFGIEHKWRRIHLLTGAHAYKLAWQPLRHQPISLRWFSPSLRGSAFSWYDRAHRILTS